MDRITTTVRDDKDLRCAFVCELLLSPFLCDFSRNALTSIWFTETDRLRDFGYKVE